MINIRCNDVTDLDEEEVIIDSEAELLLSEDMELPYFPNPDDEIGA